MPTRKVTDREKMLLFARGASDQQLDEALEILGVERRFRQANKRPATQPAKQPSKQPAKAAGKGASKSPAAKNTAAVKPGGQPAGNPPADQQPSVVTGDAPTQE